MGHRDNRGSAVRADRLPVQLMPRHYPVSVIYDPELKRPGCVLLQAAMGGDMRVAELMDSRTWLTDITPGMRKYRIDSEDQVHRLVRITTQAQKERISG